LPLSGSLEHYLPGKDEHDDPTCEVVIGRSGNRAMPEIMPMACPSRSHEVEPGFGNRTTMP
jgi:hypothetical protein